MRTIKVKRVMSDAEARKEYAGKLLDAHSYDMLLANEDVTAVDEDGIPLVILRSGVLSKSDCINAFNGLEKSATESRNRGMAGGVEGADDNYDDSVKSDGSSRFRPVRKGGYVSKTNEAKPVQSGIVGYFDRNPRMPYCRLTAYNINHPTRFAQAMPLIRRVDDVFAESHPQRYENQRKIVSETESDFYISGTVFSTITVNMNWQTAVHKDKGDYKDGFGVLTAIRKGTYAGGYFVLPEYRIAVDMRTGDVMLADVHKWHGNTPMIGTKGLPFRRMSLVFYYRERMKECGTAEQELKRAQNERGAVHLDWD